MKKDWLFKTLGELCNLYQPHTISTKDFVPDGKYDVFGANGVIGKYNKYNHEHSELLLTCRGATCGNINESTPKAWINGNAMVIHIKDEKILNKAYLKYALSFIDKSRIITGTAQPQITRQTLSPLIVAFPSLTEQCYIVSYLDAEFAKIEALKANAEKQLQDAKDLFQAALKDLMTPKKGWTEKKLGEIGEVIGGTTPDTNVPEFWNGDNCWISPAELKGNHYLYDSAKKITELAIKKKNLKLLPIGSVILSSRAPIGKVVINKVPTYCNQGFKCVVCKKNYLYNEFLYWFFYGNTDYLNSLGTGATFLEISKRTVENIPIIIPSILEQQQIAAKLDELFAKVKSLGTNFTETITLCNDLKQALLKKVFE